MIILEKFNILLQNQCGEGKYPLISTVSNILNGITYSIRKSDEEQSDEDVPRVFTEEELKLEEEGANRAIQLGNGRPIDVDPNSWVK